MVIAVTHAVLAVSGFALTMEFGQDHDIPIHIATVGLFVGVVSIGILLFGLVAKRWGFPVIFVMCTVCGIVAAMVFSSKVVEPRKRIPPPVRDVR